ncbi:flagellar hook capping protein [Paenibacillus sp. oral taxon 786 str. D14]|uniref:flagellar hook assembly protein FlgD n=1 Tax=Paenibacillus sp. oral taxon 786 TaxID=652715 RepID=UPI0001AFCD2E|nr:flagellar hook capping FlgD N-terminal domain-containing protein [Paenibacillus sp. oral taxon 786]EES75058.1 flagellar hook capping protein [Paenibacillus sp. oral taxon 786 str. D14]
MADTYFSSVSWPNYSQSNVQKASTKSNELGKDAFLKLMIAQMQNQDPLSPMDNTQMVAQIAQFTSVEQLTNISEQIAALGESLGNDSGLIGKEVTWVTETKTGNYDVSTGKAEVIIEKESGIVESIIVRSGVHYVKVGDKEIKISDIEQVGVPADASDGAGQGADLL